MSEIEPEVDEATVLNVVVETIDKIIAYRKGSPYLCKDSWEEGYLEGLERAKDLIRLQMEWNTFTGGAKTAPNECE